MRGMTRRWAVVGLGALLAAVLAGGVVAAQFRGFDDPEKLFAAIREDPLVRVADIAAAGDAPSRGVFVQVTSTGHFCLWDAPSADSRRRQGGCNSADDPLGGRPLSISFAYEGGPAVADVRDARLVGLAAADVAAVSVVMSDGTRRGITLRKASVGADQYLAFGYRVSQGDLRRGVTPMAVLAFSGNGAEIDRQATGLTG